MGAEGEVKMELDAASQLGLQASVKYMVCQFLEESHYGMLHAALSTRWDRLHSLSAAMKLMEQYGVVLKPEEVERLSGMDEMQQINALVMKMPQQSNEQFQHFFLQLQLIVSTATRVRRALEEGNSTQVQEALNDAESTGIAPYILKMAIVQAGSEVTGLKRNLEVFIKDAEMKMSKMLRGQDDAMVAQRKLAQAQAQLASFQTQGNEKAKKVLMSLASGSGTAMQASAFHGWKDYTRQMKVESAIRSEYEERIEAAEKRLLEYKAAQVTNVRGMLLKKAMANDQLLVAECFKIFKDVLEEKKWNAENAEKIKELEAKLASVAASQKENTKKVMMKMGANNDTALVTMCFQGWVQFGVEYKKDKEMNDAVKAQEARMAEFMKGKSENAQKLLNQMSSGTETGLMQQVFAGWKEVWEDIKKEKEMEDILNNSSGRFKSFGDRNAKSAKNAMSKASYAVDYMCMLTTFNAWRMDTKLELTRGGFQNKIEAKKQQLMGVQQMFRNFAQQLESGLKEGVDSSRDLRDGPPQRWKQQRMQKSDGTVSLPDIHQKQGAMTPKQGSGSRRGMTPGRSPSQPPGYREEGPPPPRNAW